MHKVKTGFKIKVINNETFEGGYIKPILNFQNNCHYYH